MELKSLIPFTRKTTPATLDEDPFLSLHRQIDRLFEDMYRSFDWPVGRFFGGNGVVPSVDVRETDDGLTVTAELPGVDEKDIELELTDDALVIRGEKKAEMEDKGGGYFMVERSYGSFLRRIPLPFEIDEDKVDAKFAKGVLTIHLPKSAKAKEKVHKIKVKAA